MNKFKGITQSLRWFMAFLLVAFVAGCGGGSGGGVAPGSTKAITAYSLAAYPGAVVTIVEPLKTIRVLVPYGTPVSALTSLVATFTSTGAGLPTVGGVKQVSGTTANDFTLPKPYIVTAADGTTATYTVTVFVALASSKGISSFKFAAYPASIGTITGATSPFAIAVTVPYGTSLATPLVATFASTGAGLPTVGGVNQVSGTTANNFTAPVVYTVTAADTTTATYTVTVTVAPNFAKAITAFSFVGYPASIGVITGAASPFAIAVPVPNGTPVTALVATFVTTGVKVTVGVGAVTQVSGPGGTLNNFTSPVAYTVHAADGTTAVYNVTVTPLASASLVCTGTVASCVPLGLADNFTLLAETKITSVPTSPITGNIGVSPAPGSTMVVSCAEMLTGKVYQVDAAFADSACSLSGTVPTLANKTYVDTAVANMLTAYNDAAGRAVTALPTELGAGNISGMTLVPGVYKWSTSVLIYANNPKSITGGDTTGVTLDCTAGGSTSVFIFQIATAQTLTLGQLGTAPTGGPAQINLKGGCLASNIFWQVGGDVTIYPASVFNGNILTATQVIMQAGAVLHGRALAQTAVTLISNAVGP